jgi:hypothetical protein
MNIHENQNNSYRSKSTCGYCRTEGHNQYQCPHVKGDWENFLSKWSIPVDTTGRPIKRGYHCVAHFYGNSPQDPLTVNVYNNGFVSWFRSCRKAYIEQKKRGFKLDGTHKRKTSSAPKKCGFCGSTNHTRRTCPTMKQFLKDCYKANENWRRAAYKELVEVHGLSVGACVLVKESSWNQEETTSTGIITDINWDTINVLSSGAQQSSFAHSPLRVKVLVNGDIKELKELSDKFKTIGKNGEGSRYWGLKLQKVITHSPTPLPPEWITSYKESFETLVKKRSLEQLKDGMASEYRSLNILSVIKAWK